MVGKTRVNRFVSKFIGADSSLSEIDFSRPHEDDLRIDKQINDQLVQVALDKWQEISETVNIDSLDQVSLTIPAEIDGQIKKTVELDVFVDNGSISPEIYEVRNHYYFEVDGQTYCLDIYTDWKDRIISECIYPSEYVDAPLEERVKHYLLAYDVQKIMGTIFSNLMVQINDGLQDSQQTQEQVYYAYLEKKWHEYGHVYKTITPEQGVETEVRYDHNEEQVFIEWKQTSETGTTYLQEVINMFVPRNSFTRVEDSENADEMQSGYFCLDEFFEGVGPEQYGNDRYDATYYEAGLYLKFDSNNRLVEATALDENKNELVAEEVTTRISIEEEMLESGIEHVITARLTNPTEEGYDVLVFYLDNQFKVMSCETTWEDSFTWLKTICTATAPSYAKVGPGFSNNYRG